MKQLRKLKINKGTNKHHYSKLSLLNISNHCLAQFHFLTKNPYSRLEVILTYQNLIRINLTACFKIKFLQDRLTGVSVSKLTKTNCKQSTHCGKKK